MTYKTALAEQIDDMAVALEQCKEERTDFEVEREQLREERNMLAYENKNMAGFLKYNDKGLTDSDVGDIATSTIVSGIWDRYLTRSAYEYANDQLTTMRDELIDENYELRRKLRLIENITNDTNEDDC